jgi:hypothetical protein
VKEADDDANEYVDPLHLKSAMPAGSSWTA